MIVRCWKVAFLALVLAGCTETSGPGGGGGLGGIFGGISLGNGGLGGAGNQGYAGTASPDSFSYLFNRANFGEEGACVQTGACGHGGVATQYGSLTGSP